MSGGPYGMLGEDGRAGASKAPGGERDPAVLAGMTWAGVAAALRDPSSSVAQGVDGAANVITAAICTITGNQPSAVCSSSTIRGLEARL
jgi:hypothetical protein